MEDPPADPTFYMGSLISEFTKQKTCTSDNLITQMMNMVAVPKSSVFIAFPWFGHFVHFADDIIYKQGSGVSKAYLFEGPDSYRV